MTQAIRRHEIANVGSASAVEAHRNNNEHRNNEINQCLRQ